MEWNWNLSRIYEIDKGKKKRIHVGWDRRIVFLARRQDDDTMIMVDERYWPVSVNSSDDADVDVDAVRCRWEKTKMKEWSLRRCRRQLPCHRAKKKTVGLQYSTNTVYSTCTLPSTHGNTRTHDAKHKQQKDIERNKYNYGSHICWKVVTTVLCLPNRIVDLHIYIHITLLVVLRREKADVERHDTAFLIGFTFVVVAGFNPLYGSCCCCYLLLLLLLLLLFWVVGILVVGLWNLCYYYKYNADVK